MSKKTLLMSAALTLAAAGALAAPPSRIRGTVTSLDGTALHIMASGGRDVVILSPNYSVTAVVPAKLSEVQPGSFIGTAADTQPDGTLVAKEVHVFPESMRGSGEGHRGFDLGPKSTMTNGTVGQEVKGTSGNTLTVAYKGGEKSILVPPGVPVVSFAPGDRSMLVQGAHVIVQTQAGAGRALMAERVIVGKDGLVPPM
jgi:hypothetical protein